MSQQKEKVIGIRGTLATEERLENLLTKTGLSSKKEVLERLLDSYEAQLLSENLQIDDLEILKFHLSRVEEMYIALAKKSIDRKEQDTKSITELEMKLQEVQNAANEAQQNALSTVKEAKKEAELAQAELLKKKNEYIATLDKINEALAAERKAKEQAMRLVNLSEGTVNELRMKLKELEPKLKQIEGLEKENIDLNNEVKLLKFETRQLTEQFELKVEKAVLQTRKEAIEEQKVERVGALQEIKELRTQLDCERQARDELRQKIAELELKLLLSEKQTTENKIPI